ncbi:hypothetical protein GPECTOR_1g203 [Gonium pectorale]|uniref:Uncharacterized protein n=1 Tax=Gonium pectorale TaxID=33097 RepID=A0A150H2H5_GONPE|nr:hypothetical protein GPECTOR_1g203 [Gonium pectorale]|eukprot:KXZ56234.1 hypothetical protein GPECTOR_1g203 [Gonium pectorale]
MTALLQEWVADVGVHAGLTVDNTRISSGSVGVAESRLELEVTWGSLAEWEQFLASIPAKEHRQADLLGTAFKRAWSQRVQGMIVGGSPRWELFRAVPAFPDGVEPAAVAVPASRPAASAAATALDASSWAADLVQATSSSSSSSARSTESKPGGEGGSGLTFVDSPEAAEVVLDWKGEPLKINPGDKLPFKFL